MAILNFPSVFPSAETWSLVGNTGVFESSLDLSAQTTTLSGGKWRCEQTFTNLTPALASALRGFLASLDGKAGRFYLSPGMYVPQGTASGTPLVAGAGQSGSALNTDGWAASQTVLKAGDYLSVNDELKVVTSDCISNGSGAATIYFKPAMRAVPADDAQIVVTNPRCVMRIANDDQAAWSLSVSNVYAVSFSCEEAI